MDVDGEPCSPGANLAQEQIIKLFGSASRAFNGEATIKVAGVDCIPREERPDFVKLPFKVLTRKQMKSRYGCLIRHRGDGTAIIDRQMPEVGQNGNRQTT